MAGPSARTFTWRFMMFRRRTTRRRGCWWRTRTARREGPGAPGFLCCRGAESALGSRHVHAYIEEASLGGSPGKTAGALAFGRSFGCRGCGADSGVRTIASAERTLALAGAAGLGAGRPFAVRRRFVVRRGALGRTVTGVALQFGSVAGGGVSGRGRIHGGALPGSFGNVLRHRYRLRWRRSFPGGANFQSSGTLAERHFAVGHRSARGLGPSAQLDAGGAAGLACAGVAGG